jgi:trehalose-6-phosphate synthase
MFAIAPKCYILKSSKNENDENVKKMKGVSFRLNDNIELESYKRCLLKSSNHVMGINRGFVVVESDPYSHIRHMVKYEQKKKAINRSALDNF